MKRLHVIVVTTATALGTIASACSLATNGALAVLTEPGDASTDAAATPAVPSDGSSAIGDAEPARDAGAAPDAAPADANAPDASPSAADAAPPPPPPPPPADAGCVGVVCDGQCMPTDSCETCPAGHALCPATRECGDCARCVVGGAPFPVACYVCDATGHHPVGTCQPDDGAAFCLDGTYPDGGTHCACPNFDVSACPGDDQVCVQVGSATPVCVTCGEASWATDQAVCQGDKSCNENARPPRCR